MVIPAMMRLTMIRLGNIGLENDEDSHGIIMKIRDKVYRHEERLRYDILNSR